MGRAMVIHMSDVHIHRTLPGGGAVWHTNGHDVRAVEAFSRARRRIVNLNAGKNVLVVSGDVSARGDNAELWMYQQFRDQGTSLPGRIQAGPFRDGCHDALDIPGNHDFWDGTVIPNPTLNTRVRGTFFNGPRSVEVRLGRGVRGLPGLCSTSGATPNEQFWAVGAFDGMDLADLRGRVARTDQSATSLGLKCAHLLVTHHSPSSGKPFLKGLARHAALDLQNICLTLKIAGLLTGHSHKWGLQHQAALPAEARSGTTLQGDTWIPWKRNRSARS